MPSAHAAPLALRSLPRLLGVALALALVLTPVFTAQAEGITHVVQPGENLFRIGLRYGVSWLDIMAANGLTSTYIYPGEVLIIPTGSGAASPASVPTETAIRTPQATSSAAVDSTLAADSSTYVVKRGDSLYQIALNYHLTVSELMRANGIFNPNLIYAGQVLAVPTADTGHWLSVAGHPQTLSLSCEARSAADWAGYFGVYIGELDFLYRLPASDDPDTGFVGNAHSVLGQTPPYSYGVHAGPVAALLQAYGLNARAASGLSWEDVRAEIDRNRPIIVWVVSHVGYGSGFYYTAASNGHMTLVAPYEHTVIVTGYDANTVTVLDGDWIYTRSLAQFMASWGALGNQAVLAQ
jgi:LysM repeat protein